MSELDQLELGKAIGRVDGKMDMVLDKIDGLERTFTKKIEKHDEHLTAIQKHIDQQNGANHILLAVYSFCMIGFWKLIEHFPAIVKSIIG